ncbi:hypothetical protein TNCV_5105251 [Trichonephila clavipes]|nr:hypothetical protein TNCV_5105251 [Trichonephila clavipes]
MEVSGSEEYSESIIKWLSRISRFTKENTKISNGNDTDKSLDSSINEGTKLVSDSKFEIWEGGFDWDEELGKHLRTKWKKMVERAYGAIAYIRYKANSDFHVNFVSKTRVAPLKKLSLRRLELLATLIGARLLETSRKVFRITAWIRRFVNNMKLIKKYRFKTPLTAEEIEEAEEIWIKKVQAENFGIEICCLKENKNLPKDSKIRELNPFRNERGIVRISGRLHQSTLSYHENIQI